MKNIFKIKTSLLAVLGLIILSHPAFADFSQYKIVGALNSTVEKTVFSFDETPFLYLKLPQTGDVFTGTFWSDPDSLSFFSSTQQTSSPLTTTVVGSDPTLISGLERWLSLANWDSIKKAGTWEVASNYFYTNGATGTGLASFAVTVTPEPVSMMLFFVGGAPMAVSLYRKHKKTLI